MAALLLAFAGVVFAGTLDTPWGGAAAALRTAEPLAAMILRGRVLLVRRLAFDLHVTHTMCYTKNLLGLLFVLFVEVDEDEW